jgi:hypothetical protein
MRALSSRRGPRKGKNPTPVVGAVCLGIDVKKATGVGARERLGPVFMVDAKPRPPKRAPFTCGLEARKVEIKRRRPEERRGRLLLRCHSWLRPGGTILGSSHLTKPGQPRGFYTENYHGVEVNNFRASLAQLVAEVEDCGYEVVFAARDYRVDPADWANWVARADDVAPTG